MYQAYNYNGYEKTPLLRPWDRVDEAQRYLLAVAQGKLPPDLLRKRDDEEVKQLSLFLAHVLRLLQDDFKATTAIRKAFADEHRTDTPLESYLSKLAATVVPEPEKEAQ